MMTYHFYFHRRSRIICKRMIRPCLLARAYDTTKKDDHVMPKLTDLIHVKISTMYNYWLTRFLTLKTIVSTISSISDGIHGQFAC